MNCGNYGNLTPLTGEFEINHDAKHRSFMLWAYERAIPVILVRRGLLIPLLWGMI